MLKLELWLRKHGAKFLTVWVILILIACFIPAQEVRHIPLKDKWGHFVLFAVLCFLALYKEELFFGKRILVIMIACALYGWLVEILQGWLSFLGRSNDPMDTFADAVGVVFGYIAYFFRTMLMRGKLNQI